MLDKGGYDSVFPYNTFKFFAHKHIEEYQVLVENEEHIPDHKHICDFLKRIAASEMGEIKSVIAAVQGSTFPTLETFVT